MLEGNLFNPGAGAPTIGEGFLLEGVPQKSRVTSILNQGESKVGKQKLIAVVGPTASGKTRLATGLARYFDGEVISCDSMQIYKELSIATAKPTLEEMEGIPHHLIDFLDLEESFSVSEYVKLARKTIADVHSRGKMPVIAGGTGLYVDSLLNNISFTEHQRDKTLYRSLYEEAERDGGQRLYAELCRIDPEAAKEIHPNNRVRLVRAVELYRLTGKTLSQHKSESRRIPTPYDCCTIGIAYRDRQKLYERINRRVDMMLEQGLLQEAERVYVSGNLKTASNAIGYKELVPYFSGEEQLSACIDKIKQESRRYAKRQLTWFRRNPQIHWIYADEFERFDNIIEISQKTVENSWNI